MVLVWVDHEAGGLDDVALQAVTLARRLAEATGSPLVGVAVGEGAADAAGTLGSYGVSTLHVVSDDRLTGYAPVANARALSSLLDGAGVVVAPGSVRGNEVMAHLGALTDLPVAADCTEVRPGSPVEVTRSRWGGSMFEEARVHADVALVTVAPHAVSAETSGGGRAEVAELAVELSDADLLVQAARADVEEESGKVSLADAKVVVSGGRGVGSAEGFAPLEELAELLGGAVGCSRVVTSAGWRPHSDQVGQTGTKVSPDLYIACGISGATQHLAGCRTSKTIMVINSDPEAPMLAHADYAVIGDVQKILPAIVAETQQAQA